MKAIAFSNWGRATATTGQVEALGVSETKTGSKPVAIVRVDGSISQVRLPAYSDCRAGDRIHLLRRNGLFGPSYAAANTPDLCAR